jgi:AcrR family transcriptional regulator
MSATDTKTSEEDRGRADVAAPSTVERLSQARRKLMEDELVGAARTLFTERGYDGVTVEDIAAAAGVSTRTFYRYFAAKEELVVVVAERLVRQLAQQLGTRLTAESPVDAIYQVLARPDPDSDEEFLAWAKICANNPALIAYHKGAMHARARGVLSAVFAKHLGVDPARDMRPDVIAGAIIGAMDVATERWSLGAGDRNALLSEALMILRTSLTAPLESKQQTSRSTVTKTGVVN